MPEPGQRPCTAAKNNASQPSIGCRMNNTAMYTGVQGVSKNARMPLPVRNWRIWIRSPKERAGLTPEGARLASKAGIEHARAQHGTSSRTPERTNTRERIHSANAMTQNRNRVINDIASSVSSLRLTITRSYLQHVQRGREHEHIASC